MVKRSRDQIARRQLAGENRLLAACTHAHDDQHTPQRAAPQIDRHTAVLCPPPVVPLRQRPDIGRRGAGLDPNVDALAVTNQRRAGQAEPAPFMHARAAVELAAPGAERLMVGAGVLLADGTGFVAARADRLAANVADLSMVLAESVTAARRNLAVLAAEVLVAEGACAPASFTAARAAACAFRDLQRSLSTCGARNHTFAAKDAPIGPARLAVEARPHGAPAPAAPSPPVLTSCSSPAFASSFVAFRTSTG